MAGKKDIAWVADQVNTTLKTYLPAKLNTLDTEYNDGIVLEDIPNDNYFIAELQKRPSYPLLCTIPDRTDQVPFSGEASYEIEYHYLTLALALTANSGEDVLKRRVTRTLRAIGEVLDTYFTLGDTVEEVLQLERQYAPLMVGRENMLLQEGQQLIRVQTLT